MAWCWKSILFPSLENLWKFTNKWLVRGYPNKMIYFDAQRKITFFWDEWSDVYFSVKREICHKQCITISAKQPPRLRWQDCILFMKFSITKMHSGCCMLSVASRTPSLRYWINVVLLAQTLSFTWLHSKKSQGAKTQDLVGRSLRRSIVSFAAVALLKVNAVQINTVQFGS